MTLAVVVIYIFFFLFFFFLFSFCFGCACACLLAKLLYMWWLVSLGWYSLVGHLLWSNLWIFRKIIFFSFLFYSFVYGIPSLLPLSVVYCLILFFGDCITGKNMKVKMGHLWCWIIKSIEITCCLQLFRVY